MEIEESVMNYSNQEYDDTIRLLKDYWQVLRDMRNLSVGEALWVVLDDIKKIEQGYKCYGAPHGNLDDGIYCWFGTGRKYEKELIIIRDFAKFIGEREEEK